MTTIEALNKIKAMFADAPAPAPAEPTPAPATPDFKEYVLKDGTKVKIDSMEVGGKVLLVDDMGNESPAPMGDLELADGTIVCVDETGTITQCGEPAPAPAPAPEEPVAQEDMTSKKIAELEAQISDLKKTKCTADAVKEVEAKFSKAITELTDIIVGLASTPSAKPTETPREKFNKQTENNKAKVERFLNLAKSIK